MDTVTLNLKNLKEYFTSFSSKEDYLQKRDSWRDLYFNLSYFIRKEKHYSRTYSSLYDKASNRVLRENFPDFSGSPADLWFDFMYNRNSETYNEKFSNPRDKIFNEYVEKTRLKRIDKFSYNISLGTFNISYKYDPKDYKYIATELLEIRKIQKKLSKEQREKQLRV